MPHLFYLPLGQTSPQHYQVSQVAYNGYRDLSSCSLGDLSAHHLSLCSWNQRGGAPNR